MIRLLAWLQGARLRAVLDDELDVLAADGDPLAIELAERVRAAKADAWDEGFHAGVDGDLGNPYEPDVLWDRGDEVWPGRGGWDGS